MLFSECHSGKCVVASEHKYTINATFSRYESPQPSSNVSFEPSTADEHTQEYENILKQPGLNRRALGRAAIELDTMASITTQLPGELFPSGLEE